MTRASDLARLIGAGATINDGTTITTADNDPQLILTSTDADGDRGPVLQLKRDSGSPADNDTIGRVQFLYDDDGGNETTAIQMEGTVPDVSDGSEDATFNLVTMVGGTTRGRVKIDSTETIFNDDGVALNFRVEGDTNANMLFVDGGNSRVGIGTNSPSEIFEINSGSGNIGAKLVSTDSLAVIAFKDNSTSDVQFLGADGDNLVFYGGTSPTERMRINSSGHVLLGTTTDGTTAVGTVIRDAGEVLITRASNPPLLVNRTTSSGDIIEIRQDNTRIGGIGIASDSVALHGGGTGAEATGFFFVKSSATPRIVPCQQNFTINDDVVDLGHSSQRFDDIFATNGTIQTSDRNEKQDIEELTSAEKRVAVVAKGLMRKFRWKSKVAKKGDKARTHFGIIAQDLEDAFKAEGLDASKYAMFISSTWWEKEITVDAVEADEAKGIEAKDAYTYMDTKEEATEVYTEKTRLGVRYSELLAFIISAI